MTLNPTVSGRLALLTGLTTLLAACGNTTIVITPKPTEVAGLIPGQITPFTAGDANSVHEANGTPANQSGGDSLVDAGGNLVMAAVSPQGQFDLPLPKAATMTTSPDASLLFSFPDVFGVCTTTSSTIPAGLKVYPINKLTTDKGQDIVSQPDANSTVFTFRAWWFSNMDATVKYKGNCFPLGDIDTTFALKKGWNLLLTATNGNTTTYTVSTQPTTHVAWQPYNTTKMASLGLSPDVLTPWRALPQYRNR